jgi:pimeloyl-ACP methyl ester carboxylesterase
MRVRFNLSGVLKLAGVVALALLIEGCATVPMSALENGPAPRGQMIEVAPGRQMRLVCLGPAAGARPTVILEAGAFGFSADWAAVQEKLAEAGLRSCAYDRAGLGHSDPGPLPRDSLAIAADLEKLLAAAGERGPFILCGHSMAGLHLRVFAARNGARVVGVVLVDATTPETMEQPAARHFVAGFAHISRLAAWGAETGLQRPLSGAFGDMIGLPAPARLEKRWAFADARHNRWAAAEVSEWAKDAEEGRKAGPYDRRWPVGVVLTGGGADELERPGESGETPASQEVPAQASRAGFIVRAPGANHATLLGQHFAPRIVEAILKVEAAASER